MRGCIFFNRSYTKWQHALAVDLALRHGITDWCAYAYGRKPSEFLQKQKEITYCGLLIDGVLAVRATEEEVNESYLGQREQLYGVPFLTPFFVADRNMIYSWPRDLYVRYRPLFNHHQIKQQLQLRIKEIEKMLDRCRPDFVIMSSVCAMGSMLLYAIARHRGIRIIIIDPIRFSNRIGLTEDMHGRFTSAEDKYRRLESGEYHSPIRQKAKIWLDQYRIKPARPKWAVDAMEQKVLRSPLLLIKNFVRRIIDYYDETFPSVYDGRPLDYIRRSAQMIMNRYRRYSYSRPVPGESYAFFMFHYEPELSLMVFAPYRTNQLEVVRDIARSLPINFKLYVKEHPAMMWMRDPAFYKEVAKIPNVRLIDPTIDSLDLVREAKFVTVITSTVGLEAALLRKPVIVFGSVFYDVLPNVKRCRAMEELPMLISQSLTSEAGSDESLINLISAALEESIDIDIFKDAWYGDVNVGLVAQDDDLRALSDAIMHFASRGYIT